jgi:hypothetical protein
MKIETQLVIELYYVLKQMIEENKGDYSITLPTEDIVIMQCKVNDIDKTLELL